MSSIATQTDRGLFSTFPASYHMSSEDEATDKPEVKPSDAKMAYQPTRASWHTITGKIKSFLA